jgi:hypothetical protein
MSFNAFSLIALSSISPSPLLNIGGFAFSLCAFAFAFAPCCEEEREKKEKRRNG